MVNQQHSGDEKIRGGSSCEPMTAQPMVLCTSAPYRQCLEKCGAEPSETGHVCPARKPDYGRIWNRNAESKCIAFLLVRLERIGPYRGLSRDLLLIYKDTGKSHDDGDPWLIDSLVSSSRFLLSTHQFIKGRFVIRKVFLSCKFSIQTVALNLCHYRLSALPSSLHLRPSCVLLSSLRFPTPSLPSDHPKIHFRR
ncbi:hypothetical protein BCR34DRAFT_143253 [Clohesyomyces aquaticus]|uniref:Uncharacterized protein n=1 Tax=Clohesyomyces aquaticus TaxID=1231657 RepID=A0A1Y1YL94_9PLEO|nr:hypothetical protein BCR34DRAFT_143253 [Clohesyomyces aquaticus]